MRAYLAAIVALFTIMAPILSARSDEIPTLKIEPLCHGIATQGFDPLAGGEPSVSYDRCIEQSGHWDVQ
jgi:hypothetical protein